MFVMPVLQQEFFRAYVYKVGTSMELEDSHDGWVLLIEQCKNTSEYNTVCGIVVIFIVK